MIGSMRAEAQAGAALPHGRYGLGRLPPGHRVNFKCVDNETVMCLALSPQWSTSNVRP